LRERNIADDPADLGLERAAVGVSLQFCLHRIHIVCAGARGICNAGSTTGKAGANRAEV
jgi:hypothetical protein